MNETKVVTRYYADGERITNEEFRHIVFSHYLIDKILQSVNMRLGLIAAKN